MDILPPGDDLQAPVAVRAGALKMPDSPNVANTVMITCGLCGDEEVLAYKLHGVEFGYHSACAVRSAYNIAQKYGAQAKTLLYQDMASDRVSWAVAIMPLLECGGATRRVARIRYKKYVEEPLTTLLSVFGFCYC